MTVKMPDFERAAVLHEDRALTYQAMARSEDDPTGEADANNHLVMAAVIRKVASMPDRYFTTRLPPPVLDESMLGTHSERVLGVSEDQAAPGPGPMNVTSIPLSVRVAIALGSKERFSRFGCNSPLCLLDVARRLQFHPAQTSGCHPASSGSFPNPNAQPPHFHESWEVWDEETGDWLDCPEYDSDWAATGPLIHRLNIGIERMSTGWMASMPRNLGFDTCHDYEGEAAYHTHPLSAVCMLIVQMNKEGKLKP